MDAKLHLWDLNTGHLLQTLEVTFCGAISQVLWLDDHRFVCGCAKGMLCVFLRGVGNGLVGRIQPITRELLAHDSSLPAFRVGINHKSPSKLRRESQL